MTNLTPIIKQLTELSKQYLKSSKGYDRLDSVEKVWAAEFWGFGVGLKHAASILEKVLKNGQ